MDEKVTYYKWGHRVVTKAGEVGTVQGDVRSGDLAVEVLFDEDQGVADASVWLAHSELDWAWKAGKR